MLKGKSILSITISALMLLSLSACKGMPEAGVPSASIPSASVTPNAPSQVETPSEAVSASYSKSVDCTVKLGESVSISGSGAVAENGVITVSQAGDYLFSGKLSGQIIVDAPNTDKVTLILNGVDVTSPDSAAIYVLSAEKVVIELVEGSVNLLADANEYSLQEGSDEPSACIFAKDDLKIKGSGTLYVTGNYNKGIFTKDDMQIQDGNIFVVAKDDAIRGKDSVQIEGGTLTLEAGGDGLRTSNTEQEGYIDIKGGSISIISALDAIQAESNINISGGSITVQSGGGSANSSQNNDSWGDWGDKGPGGGMPGGMPGGKPGGMPPGGRAAEQTASPEDTASAKGIKCQGTLTISGGSFSLDTSDDAIHSNTVINISGGSFNILSGDDGIHADDTLTVSGGSGVISKSYEGLEAENIVLSGGKFDITSSDDGFNAAGGNDGSAMERPGFGGFMGGGEAGSGSISIKGGEYTINAEGDGVDSNGNIEMTDGTVIVYGPVSGGNGAMDYSGTCKINGGILCAVGSAGMAQTVNSDTQGCIGVQFFAQANTKVDIADASGNTVFSITSPKTFQTLVMSHYQLKKGAVYSVLANGEKLGEITAS